MSLGMCVSNTFINNDVERQATFHDVWQSLVAPISHKGFAQLDLVLCSREELWQVKQVRSDRWEALASHHFLVEVVADVGMEVKAGGENNHASRARHLVYNYRALAGADVKTRFANRFEAIASEHPHEGLDCEQLVGAFCSSIREAASETIPEAEICPRRPWIQNNTLKLIEERSAARKHRDRPEEIRLNTEIKKSARRDRANWISNAITTGSWEEIKKFKRKRKINISSRRLNDENGVQVESSQRADTFATHLETVQWAVRPMNTLEGRPPLGASLPVSTQTIALEELRKAIRQLRSNRAAVQVPAELLKALDEAGSIDADCWLLKIMQLCWDSGTTPSSWHIAKVCPIYKKGDPAACDNYRPISLVSVLYKVYATILLNRLKSAGAEKRLWSRQFGFRSKRSTEDALFIVRRRIEQALAAKGGKCCLLALDWRKAFDSIAPDRLIWALERFGVNQPMLAIIKDIYTERRFTVADAGHESSSRPQMAGISQGCPLSPFLFGMVMTVLMTDARATLSGAATAACDRDELEDTLFADDTLLISRCASHLEEYMAAVEEKGRDYGLQVHWGKVHLISIDLEVQIRAPSGDAIPPKTSMLHLGSTIHADGKYGCEVSRKIGAARAEFRALLPVWKSPVLAKSRKMFLFEVLITSMLRYGTASAWLSKSDLRRIDGFQANCLRTILRIPPSFLSRITNEKVRQCAGQKPTSTAIRSAQLELMGKVFNDPGKKYLKDVAFDGDTLTPRTASSLRRVGRPRHNWTDQLLDIAKGIAGSTQAWQRATRSNGG